MLLDDYVHRLRAAAEPTRLRLLAACAEGELTVTELCRIVDQSQPRVSRHLKLLCEAALLLRFREEHFVYYRTPTRAAAASVVKRLLEELDAADPVLERDRRRAAQVREERVRVAAASRDRRAPRAATGEVEEEALRVALLEELGSAGLGELLDIGTGTGRILRWLASRATQAVGVDLASDALRIARTTVHGAGLRHCILQKGDMYGLPFPDHSFDTVTMDRALGDAERPIDALREAVRMLKPGGRLVVVEDFDDLDLHLTAAARHPLAMLRGWLAQAGAECERLRPIDCGAAHLLLAIARPAGELHAAA
jgi:ArsR family transcriptional regulator